jgi:hypothetical protein
MNQSITSCQSRAQLLRLAQIARHHLRIEPLKRIQPAGLPRQQAKAGTLLRISSGNMPTHEARRSRNKYAHFSLFPKAWYSSNNSAI